MSVAEILYLLKLQHYLYLNESNKFNKNQVFTPVLLDKIYEINQDNHILQSMEIIRILIEID